jgi:hypothetical protein
LSSVRSNPVTHRHGHLGPQPLRAQIPDDKLSGMDSKGKVSGAPIRQYLRPMDNYHVIGLIGEGSFGKEYKLGLAAASLLTLMEARPTRSGLQELHGTARRAQAHCQAQLSAEL